MSLALGRILAPFALVLLTWAFAAPVRRLVERRMTEGRLKRLLLRRTN